MALQTLPRPRPARSPDTRLWRALVPSFFPSHPDPTQLQPNECLVQIEYAGVCQSDLHARNGDWLRKPTLSCIGGHEGVGTVVAIGAGTVECLVSLGDRVGLKWIARTCLHCDNFRMGNEPSKCDRPAFGKHLKLVALGHHHQI